MKKVLSEIGVVVFFFLLSIVLTFPLVLNLASHIAGDGFDNLEFFGFQTMAIDNITQGKYPFAHTDLMRYPEGVNLGLSSDGKLAVLLSAVLGILTTPIIGYNLTVLTLLILSGLVSYLFFRKLTGDQKLGLLGGVIYGFSSYMLARSGSHLNLASTFVWPLFGMAVLDLIRGKSFKLSVIKVNVAGLLLAWGSFQNLFILMIALVGLLIGGYLFERSKFFEIYDLLALHRNWILKISGVALVFLFMSFSAYFAAYYQRDINIETRSAIASENSLQLINLVVPNPYSQVLGSQLQDERKTSIEQVVHIGYAEIILLVLAIIMLVKTGSQRFVLFNLGFMFFFLTGWGYSIYGNVLPFRAIPLTSRYFVVFYLWLVVLILWYVKYAKRLQQWKYLLPLITVVVIQRVSFSYPITEISTPDYIEVVKQAETNAVLNVPVSIYNPKYDLHPYWYDKPITNGYIHWTGNNYANTLFVNNNYRWMCAPENPTSAEDGLLDIQEEIQVQQALVRDLADKEIKTVVIHKDELQKIGCLMVRKRYDLLFPKTSLLETTNQDETKRIQSEFVNQEIFSYAYEVPTDGTFVLEGLLIAPTSIDHIEVYHNASVWQKITTGWSQTSFGNSWQADRRLDLPVRQGDLIRVVSQTPLNETGYLSMWYQFLPSNVSSALNLQPKPQTVKIYNDEIKEVWLIKTQRQ